MEYLSFYITAYFALGLFPCRFCYSLHVTYVGPDASQNSNRITILIIADHSMHLWINELNEITCKRLFCEVKLKTSLPSRQEGERTSDSLGFQELRTVASWVSQEGDSGRGGTTPRGCGSPAWQLDEDKKINRSCLLPLALSLALAQIDAVQLEARIFQLFCYLLTFCKPHCSRIKTEQR